LLEQTIDGLGLLEEETSRMNSKDARYIATLYPIHLKQTDLGFFKVHNPKEF